MELLFHAIIVVNAYDIEMYILLCSTETIFSDRQLYFPITCATCELKLD